MSVQTITGLKSQATTIKNETNDLANTANRVGTMFTDIIDTFDSLNTAVNTSLADKATKNEVDVPVSFFKFMAISNFSELDALMVNTAAGIYIISKAGHRHILAVVNMGSIVGQFLLTIAEIDTAGAIMGTSGAPKILTRVTGSTKWAKLQ